MTLKQKLQEFPFFTLTIVAILFIVLSFVFESDSKIDKVSLSENKTEQIRSIARKTFDSCRKQGTSTCYEKIFADELLLNYNTQEILAAVYDYDEYFSCHTFTHFLGRALYRKIESIADSYAQSDFTCHGGIYHGVMEAYLEENQSQIESIDGKMLQGVCKDSKSKTEKNQRQIYTECLHGFGHAFMFILDSELPAALKYCDKLVEIEEKETCYGGAFMENSTSSTNSNHPSKWIKEGDKYYPCSILNFKYLRQCYYYQANYLIKISDHDYTGVFKDCDKLNWPGRDYCYLGLGANLASFSNETSIQKAASVCQIGKSASSQEICVEGAIPSLMARYGGQTQKIIDFCGQVASHLSKHCFAKLGKVAENWGYNDKDLIEICHQAHYYKEDCLGETQVKIYY